MSMHDVGHAKSQMAARGNQRHKSSYVSMSALRDQIDTNMNYLEWLESPKKGIFMRSSVSAPEFPVRNPSSSPGSTRIRHATSLPTLADGVPRELPPVRELDVDPDTYLFLCCPFPVFTLHAIRRKIWTCVRNFLWPRPPLPCVTTTCGPIFHVRSCEFHPLSGGMPYKKPVRRSISLPLVRAQRTASLPARLPSSSASDSSSPS